MQHYEELGDNMKLEVLLSVLNLDKKNLNKMNIKTDCVVINQCDKTEYKKYKNFKIYSYKERGISKSRNKALEKSTGDILLLCDDDVVYDDNYEKTIIDSFKSNPKADVIFFNLKTINRDSKANKKNKRIHIYNCLRYGSTSIAFRRETIVNNDIKFNLLFGSKEHFQGGEDTLFIVDCLKKRLKLYSSKEYIGTVNHAKSTWFKGYNEKYFYDKGALFCAINKPLRKLLFLQYLIRHKIVYKQMGFKNAFSFMEKGAKSYLEMK